MAQTFLERLDALDEATKAAAERADAVATERLTVWKPEADKIGTPSGPVAWPAWLERERDRLRAGTFWSRAWVHRREDGFLALYASARKAG